MFMHTVQDVKFGMAAVLLACLLQLPKQWIKVGVTGQCDCVVKLTTLVCVLYRAVTLLECFNCKDVYTFYTCIIIITGVYTLVK